jgi:hypothetical protein|tara:strand:- start:3022 stop:3387 length:366 start_codon:yes stop_codon:yes gene_type:complete
MVDMRVIIESPYSPGSPENIEYARRCLFDSLLRGESPFASHLLYTQVLDDTDSKQRYVGMTQALEWYETADLCAVYIDRGISSGMEFGRSHAQSLGMNIEERTLKNDSQKSVGNSFKSYWG